ncbi:hypothetical protein DFH08DRAFT_900435, partial [Mycena albidolilacea]
PGSTLFSVDICWLVVALVFSGPTRSSCASRPTSSMHRLHRFRVCTPLMCIPIATFVRCWLSHRGHRRTSREELQTTSCTPIRLIVTSVMIPGA